LRSTPHSQSQQLSLFGEGRLALSKREAARALGVSVDFLEHHVLHELRIVRRGRRRLVPIPAGLRAILAEHLLGLGWHEGLAFGREADVPFDSEPVNGRAYRAWKKAGLDRITLHECRHAFASLMIAAGVNAKALSTYMGHSSVTITFDRYGHLMPGDEQEAAGLLDDFLRRAQAL
jgi:integrase